MYDLFFFFLPLTGYYYFMLSPLAFYLLRFLFHMSSSLLLPSAYPAQPTYDLYDSLHGISWRISGSFAVPSSKYVYTLETVTSSLFL